MMLLHRLDLALHSPFGTVLIILAALLALLLASYAIWYWRKTQGVDDYFIQSEALAEPYLFKKQSQDSFWGRISTVLEKTTQVEARCLIPLEEWCKEEVCERFRLFAETLRSHPIAHIAPHLWFYAQGAKWMLVQENCEQKISLSEYLLDRKLSIPEAEALLLDIACALSELHQLGLYYGSLSPSAIYLTLDKRCELFDAGLAFAVGPELLLARLQASEDKEWSFLAPEQLDQTKLAEVGPAADFYSFAKLALKLFTHRISEDIDWSSVPEKWRPFLQCSLDPCANRRPRNFSLFSSNATPAAALDALLSSLHQVHERQKERDKKKKESLLLGNLALKNYQWERAKTHFEASLQLDPSSACAHVGLAIVHRAKSDLKCAEAHFLEAQHRDPQAVHRFYDHIAFHF